MVCRNCGTQISDKALICYRCGHATADPVRQAVPVPGGGRTGTAISVVALLVLVIAALFMGQVGTGRLPDEVPYIVAGLAAIVLVWRQWQRIRRRRIR